MEFNIQKITTPTHVLLILFISLFLLFFNFNLFVLHAILGFKLVIFFIFALITIYLIFSLISKLQFFILIFLCINYAFQNIFIGLLIKNFSFSPEETKTFLMLKDFLVFIVFVYVFCVFVIKGYVYKKKFLSNFYLTFIIFIYLLIYLIFFKYDTFSALAYIRNFSFPLIFIILGYFMLNNYRNRYYFSIFFIIIYSIVVIIALYELLIDKYMWQKLGGQIINIARGFGDISITKTVILDKVFYRLSGTFLDSVNFSYFISISIAFLISLYGHININKFLKIYILALIAVSFILSIFTFGKGGWLIISFLLFGIIIPEKLLKKNFSLIVGLILLFILLSIPIIIKLFPTSIYHFYGLINSVLNVSLTGHGLGSSGNFLKGFANISHKEWLLASESGLATMLYQLGFVFTVIYYYTIYIFGKKIYETFIYLQYRNNKLKLEYKVFLMGLLAWSIGTIFQENAFSPSSNFLLFILLGGLIRKAEEFKNAV